MDTRRQWVARVAGMVALGVGAGSEALAARTERSFNVAQSQSWRGELNGVLRDNILRFWLDKSIDREHGGYFMHFDEAGVRKAENTKAIVTQARTLWLFSRASRNDYEGQGMPARDELLSAARHGFHYLRDHMWDSTYGGFFWTLDPVAGTIPMPGKHLYGQSFALYALAEY